MKNELLKFEQYLFEQGKSEESIKIHSSLLNSFIDWCDSMNIEDIAFIGMNTILEYVAFMKRIPVKIGTQKNKLNTIKKYYDCLKAEGVISVNPFKHFRIRGDVKKVVRNPLSESGLNVLYNGYEEYLKTRISKFVPNQQEINLKKKIIMSLVIYQGLDSGELNKLTVPDINLDNSTIYIPAIGRRKSRVLSLHQSQILPLYKYLSSLPSEQNKLFCNNMGDAFQVCKKEINGINPLVQNLQQIRASVIINWVKKYGKRKAQYMIGHRYVSSTEKYELQDTTELAELIEKTHLFGN